MAAAPAKMILDIVMIVSRSWNARDKGDVRFWFLRGAKEVGAHAFVILGSSSSSCCVCAALTPWRQSKLASAQSAVKAAELADYAHRVAPCADRWAQSNRRATHS